MTRPNGAGAATGDGDLDDALRLLGDRPRRYLLYFLREQGAASLDELADVVAGWLAAGADGPTVGPDERARVLADLYHVHVPLLVDHGVVAVDGETGEVSLSSVSAPLDRLLDETLGLESAVSEAVVAEAGDRPGG